MLNLESGNNSYLLERLRVSVGEQIQVLLPGAMIRGWVLDIKDGWDTVVLTTTEEPPMTWAINARQLIAVGRVGRA